MKSRNHLLDGDLETIAIDVTEQPIERPTKRQCLYYSGKQKLHTIKVQLVICLATLEILSVVCRKGKVHDYRIFKESCLAIAPEINKLADSGYQGIAKLYTNGYTPIKKTWNQSLTGEASKFNREFAGRRIPIDGARFSALSKKPIQGNIETRVRHGMLWLRLSTSGIQPKYLNQHSH